MRFENKVDNKSNDLLTSLNIFDFMTPSERDILNVLVEFQSGVYIGKCRDISPSREYLAYKAGCSRSTVRTFIKKYEGLVFTHRKRKIAGTVKNNSNIYDLNSIFYELLVCLKYLNLYHNNVTWKKHRETVLKSMMDDPDFLSRKVYKKHKLSTHKLTLEIYQKLTCINSYSHEFHLEIGTKSKEVLLLNKKEEGKKSGILQGLPLNFVTKQKLLTNFSEKALAEARNDYIWYEKQNTIKLPDRFFMKRAKIYQHEYIQRL
jgi:hypothetical protein